MRRRLTQIAIVMMLALATYTAFVIVRALIEHHPETGVFRTAIGLLCVFLLLLLTVLTRAMRLRRRP